MGSLLLEWTVFMIHESLKLHARNILHSPDYQMKIRSAFQIEQYCAAIEGNSFSTEIFELHHRELVEFENELKKLPNTIPKWPARDSALKFSNSPVKNDFSRTEQIADILDSAVMDVEVAAIEISASIFLKEPLLPFELYKDLASHMGDEARHALELERLLKIYFPNFKRKDSYTHRVWKKAYGRNLIETLMIENVIEEGFAADRVELLIQEMEQVGLNEIAESFKKINKDEMRHSAIGNKWVKKLLHDDEDMYFELFDRLCMEINPVASRIENFSIRLESGFSKAFIKRYFR